MHLKRKIKPAIVGGDKKTALYRESAYKNKLYIEPKLVKSMTKKPTLVLHPTHLKKDFLTIRCHLGKKNINTVPSYQNTCGTNGNKEKPLI